MQAENEVNYLLEIAFRPMPGCLDAKRKDKAAA
jgi:hypothetical protein